MGQRKLDRNEGEQRRDPEPDLDERDGGKDHGPAWERRPRRGRQMAVDKAKFLLLGILLINSEMCRIYVPIGGTDLRFAGGRRRLFEFRAEAIPADLAAVRRCNLEVAFTLAQR